MTNQINHFDRVIRLRGIQAQDENFLFQVYSSSRQDEMALVGWTDEQKEAFLRMQFNAQSSYYRGNYPGAEFQIILWNEQPIGRLYIHRTLHEIRIIDITLLPDYRNQGIGAYLMNWISVEAQTNCVPITLHVNKLNPAKHLYDRLGFRLVEGQGMHLLMEWTPKVAEVDGYTG